MSTRYAFPVDLTEDPDGRWLTRFPDLPGAATDGVDKREAFLEAADCLEEALAGCIARREDIPPASAAAGRPTVSPGAVIAAKAALYTAIRRNGLRNTDLARRLGCNEAEIRRMLNPRHATKIGRLENALAAVGESLVIEVRANPLSAAKLTKPRGRCPPAGRP
jgi:antitoxin HicB